MKRVCLFTGASGILGSVFLQRYAHEYDIAAVYGRNHPAAPSQQRFFDPLEPDAPVPENAHAVFAIQADLTKEEELPRVVELALARFGRIDLLVNAAYQHVGVGLDNPDDCLAGFDDHFNLNVKAPLKLAALLVRDCWRDRAAENAARNRNVVNVSSIAGVHLFPGAGHGLYGAAKAVMNMLSLHMARELAPLGVRVNVVAPGKFPECLPTERVADTVRHLDRGTMNGSVEVIEPQAPARPACVCA